MHGELWLSSVLTGCNAVHLHTALVQTATCSFTFNRLRLEFFQLLFFPPSAVFQWSYVPSDFDYQVVWAMSCVMKFTLRPRSLLDTSQNPFNLASFFFCIHKGSRVFFFFSFFPLQFGLVLLSSEKRDIIRCGSGSSFEVVHVCRRSHSDIDIVDLKKKKTVNSWTKVKQSREKARTHTESALLFPFPFAHFFFF